MHKGEPPLASVRLSEPMDIHHALFVRDRLGLPVHGGPPRLDRVAMLNDPAASRATEEAWDDWWLSILSDYERGSSDSAAQLTAHNDAPAPLRLALDGLRGDFLFWWQGPQGKDAGMRSELIAFQRSAAWRIQPSISAAESARGFAGMQVSVAVLACVDVYVERVAPSALLASVAAVRPAGSLERLLDAEFERAAQPPMWE